MTDTATPAAVPPAARVLGYAGLLPAIVLVGGALLVPYDVAYLAPLALIYATLILSFIGGSWWGFAARVPAAPVAIWVIAVAPSIVALGLCAVLIALPYRLAPIPVAVLGACILLSPLIDGVLVRAELAPRWWPKLRWPLSIGLGSLTIVLALVVAR